ncbi:MAG: hypothetical protein RLZZ245_2998 [Verrucomicrobiota bacterium]
MSGVAKYGGGIGGGDKLVVIDTAEFEEELRLGVEACADAVKHGCKVLAESRVIWAGATEFDFLWLGEKPVVLVGDDGHDFP